MTRSLVIAPQWIGDAVMSEPLLRRLAERGEQLTVAAVPWVAPVLRAMPEPLEVVGDEAVAELGVIGVHVEDGVDGVRVGPVAVRARPGPRCHRKQYQRLE
jgi:hypothetical protein